MGPIREMSFDLSDAKIWDPVMMSVPEGGDPAILTLPPSWAKPIILEEDHFFHKFPLGETTREYSDATLHQWTLFDCVQEGRHTQLVLNDEVRDLFSHRQ